MSVSTTNPFTITENKALDAMRKAVESESPDFIYNSRYVNGCFYVSRGEPACIVGRALHSIGVPIETLSAMDVGMDGTITHPGTVEVLKDAGFLPTTAALAVMRRAQAVQDAGGTWGEAMAAALDESERL